MIAPAPVSTADDHRPTLPHVPALDGLRGVAVVGVLLFHADHLRGGFLGVDLFFTLSGFLITSLLLVEREASGGISLRRFWARRARRLLPAMLVVVAAAAVLAQQILRDDELGRFRTLAVSALAYVANWAEVAQATDYWALFATPTPLDHVWSLAIEEQFYVVWPLLVVGVARLAQPRTAVRALAAVCTIASLAASWWLLDDGAGITRTYFGTDTRAASILIGAVLATFTAGVGRTEGRVERATSAIAPLALGGILLSWTLVEGSDPWLYRFGLAGHAVLTAVVIAAVSGPAPGILGRLLTIPVLQRAGLLSYGLYLWHWPVYVWLDAARTGLDGWALTGVRLLLSVVLAELSYRLVESPIRHQQIRFPRPALTGAGAVALTALLVVVLVRPPGDRPLPPVERLVTAAEPLAVPEPDSPSAAAAPSSVTLVGDSQAFTLAVEAPAAELGIRVENAANLGCGISTRTIILHGEVLERERCASIVAALPDQVDASDPDVVAVLTGVWESSDQVVDGEVVPFGDARWAELLRADFTTAVGPIAERHRAVLVTTPCFGEGLQREEYAGEDMDGRLAAVNRVLRSAADDLGMGVVDLADHLCPEGRPRTEIDGYLLRPDGVHYDQVGARVVWPWFAAELSEVLAGSGER